MEKYISLFFISSFLGWIFEYLYSDIKNINYCGDMKKFGLCFPMYTIYGFFAIILLYLKEHLQNIKTIYLILLLIVFVGFFECFGGFISNKINNGNKTWNYNNNKCHGYIFCNGYVSALSSVGFGILSTIYYKLVIEKYF